MIDDAVPLVLSVSFIEPVYPPEVFQRELSAKEMLNSCYRETGNGCAESYGRLVSPYVAIGCLIIRY